MDRLQNACRCIAMDVRSHGRSGRGDQPWTFRDIATDVIALSSRLHLERPVVVGYSSGGTIALQAAIDDPKRFGGIVSVSGFSECCTTSMKIKVNLGLIGVRFGLLKSIGPNIISTNSVGKQHTQAMLPDARNVHPVSFRCYLQETLKVNFTNRLREITIPVLLVYGTKDEWMHSYYRILRQNLPNARSLFFDGSDHRVPTRQPDNFADAVARFLVETQPSASEGSVFPPGPPFTLPGADPYQLHT